MDCKQKTGELCQRQLVIHPKCVVGPLYYGLVPRCSCLNRGCLPFLPYPSALKMWALDCFLPRNVNRKASRLGVWRHRYAFCGRSLCCDFLKGDNAETLGDVGRSRGFWFTVGHTAPCGRDVFVNEKSTSTGLSHWSAELCDSRWL